MNLAAEIHKSLPEIDEVYSIGMCASNNAVLIDTIVDK